MANLNRKVLGSVSGRIGDLVFRQRGGNNYIGQRPLSFMPGTDEASVNRRSKFALTGKLASVLNRIPDLFSIWSDYDLSKNAYQNLFRGNYPYVNADRTAGNFKLTPQTGFGVSAGTIALSASEIQAEINPLGDNLGITDKEVSVKLIGLIYLTQPSDENSPAYDFIDVVSEEIPMDTDTSLVFSIPLMNQDTQLYNGYTQRSAYFTLVTLDADGSPVQFSNTFRKV